jgi:hypothetical protein
MRHSFQNGNGEICCFPAKFAESIKDYGKSADKLNVIYRKML